MSEIDIRNIVEGEIDTIRITDCCSTCSTVEVLFKYNPPRLADTETGRELAIFTTQHALNIKKAIDKAIELGWLD